MGFNANDTDRPALAKRPVAWRVRDYAGGWIIFQNEEVAYREAERMGAQMQGLYISDREMETFLAGVVGAVEANSFEGLCLWQDYHQQRKVPWVSRADGFVEQVGALDDMPVCLHLRTAEIDGHKLLFFDATSQVVDYRLIDNWLATNLPASCKQNGRINRVNAMNFHNVFPR